MSDYQNLLSRLRAKVGPIVLDEIEKLLEFNELPADALAPGSVARSVAGILADKLPSARDLGLIGSGNERTALQALLTAGVSFFIPAGMVITIGSGVTMAVDDTKIHGPGRIECSAGTFNAITITADHCEVRGVPIVGAGAENGLLTGCSVIIDGGDHNLIEDCIFTNHSRGAVIKDGEYNRIRRNLFTDGVADGSDIVLQSASSGGQVISNNLITENFCLGGGEYGIALQVLDSEPAVSECQYNVISKNRVSGHKAYGILLYDQDNDGDSVNLTSGNQIDGNIVTDITGDVEYPVELDKRYGAGIYVQSYEGTIVSGNTVERCNLETDTELLAPGGIGIANVGRITCRNNILRDNAWFGIYVNDALQYGSTDGAVDISGNNVSGSGKSGIKGTYISRFNISGNVVVDSAEFGIIVVHTTFDSNYGTVNNNFIRHNTGNNTGLQVQHTNAVTISGNTVIGSTVNGIGVFSSKQIAVTGNVITETTTDGIQIGSSNSEGISVCGNTIRKGVASTSRGINLLGRAICAGNNLYGFTNFANTTPTGNTAWNGTYSPFQSAAPAAGTWLAADVVLNSAPSAENPPGWVCTAGGTPGTWKAMASLAA